MLGKAQAEGKEVRGPVDHGFVRSVYFRDPNGYVVELTASTGVHQEMMDPALSKPHDALARWQAANIEKRCAFRIGAPGLQKKVTYEMKVELGGDVRSHAHGLKRVAENKLTSGVCIKKRPGTKQVAHAP